MAKLRVEKFVDADRHRVCELARLAHEESLFGDIPFSERKFYASFDNTIEEPDVFLGLKVHLDGKIVGFCYAQLGGFYIGEDAKVVTVISLVTDPDVRAKVVGGKAALRLVKGIELWAKTMKANHVLFHVTSGTDPVGADRFFRKLGMRTLGGNYAETIM